MPYVKENLSKACGPKFTECKHHCSKKMVSPEAANQVNDDLRYLLSSVWMTPIYSQTATSTGPSHERTGGEHGGIAQAPPARAGLTPLYSRTATITGQSHERTGGEHGGIAQAPPAPAGLTPVSRARRDSASTAGACWTDTPIQSDGHHYRTVT